MLRNLLLALLGVSVVVMDGASPDLLAQNGYPHVIGPTGRPYGPTQSHYQYERQYGRPWYGGQAQYDPNTGAQFRFQGGWGGNYYSNGAVYNGYAPYGPTYPGLPGYGAYQYGWGLPQYQVAQPPMLPLLPLGNLPTFAWQQPNAFQQPQVQQPQARQPGPPAPAPGQVDIVDARPVGQPEPVMQRPHAFLPAEPSTAAQRQRSLHLQGQGDIWFRQQNFLQAYSRYKQAAGAAGDLAAPHFRMAYALMALQRFELAVPEFQRGIRLDPQYPLTGEGPSQVYGEQNRLGAAALPQAVAAWVKQDIRSPDRLFLLGALLMMEGDPARAQVLLQTAAEFGGPAEHVVAFLKLAQPQDVAQAGPEVPAEEQPPVPEAVEKMLKENQNWLPARPLANRQAAPLPGNTTARTARPKPSTPAAEPFARPAVEPAPKAPAVATTPPESTEPANAGKTYPLEPGYVTIPKKGSTEKPAAQPEPEQPEPEVVPVEATNPSDDSGPVIPIPNSGN